MTDYAPDYTMRYKVHYLAGGFTHDMVVRGPISFSDITTELIALAGGLQTFFEAIEGALFDDFAFLNASYALPSSSVFLPTVIVPTSPTGVTDPANRSARLRATACTMAGRGSPGGSGRLYFFGLTLADSTETDPAGDGVVTVANLAGITDAKDAADAAFHSSNGSAMVFYPRFTIKVNDAALRIVRRTITV